MNSISQAINGSQANLIANSYGLETHGQEAHAPDTQGQDTRDVDGSSASDKVTLSNQASKTKTTGPDIPQEAVFLSPRAERAQKIEAMAKDFFSKGQFGIGDIPKLIQRLHQDGILSENQLNRLSQAGFEIPRSEGSQPSLLDFIASQREQLKESKPDSVMIAMLDDAESVLKQMDSLDTQGLNQKAARVSAQLSVFVQGDQGLTPSDKSMWQGLKSTMQLAAASGSSQQASGQLQRYLALSKRIT
ncbi:hypothetical protein [Shewanella halotolerans]|uniref:hypothetical protein n=1 Tax=Shewanella halotolerans TaxID=2864204 RepID=UPI001C659453|nr:hypothetical protein [Shewanella halotolerans]QYJ91392.1 hypothetical protein K0H81_07395 [Shewanella halotolerans]